MTLVPQSGVRRATRLYSRIPVTLVLGSEGYEAERVATTADISLHGVRILTEAQLLRGQTVELQSYKGGARLVKARVVWVDVAITDTTEAGLEFLD